MKTYPLYLNGVFVTTGDSRPVLDPATGQAFARMSIGGRGVVAQALASAHTAFAAWRHVVGRTRGDFLLKIAAEVERRKAEIADIITMENGKPLGQSQMISVTEALSLYTSNAAYHSFDENDLGSIEAGKLADMVILGRDLLTAPPETIKDIPVDTTILGGRIIHQRTGQQQP